MPRRKTGRLTQDERDFILANSRTMTPAEMATRLKRTEETIARWMKAHLIRAEANREEAKRQDGVGIKAELRQTEKWRRLKEELTSEEMKFFEEEYIKLVAQFGNDVLASEVTQVFDCIKFEILKSRNMAERKRARQEIARLETQLDGLMKGYDSPREMTEDERGELLGLETQLNVARAAEQSRTTEYVKLQERHDALMKSLKSTRDQRVRDASSGTDNVLSLLKKLQLREVQVAEGKQMELMRMAADKEYDRLGEFHTYEDGGLDRPILSPETVGDGDED